MRLSILIFGLLPSLLVLGFPHRLAILLFHERHAAGPRDSAINAAGVIEECWPGRTASSLPPSPSSSSPGSG